jgi:transcriptional regulator with XRE-family HTH domain
MEERMETRPSIAKIIKEQRKRIPLSLNQLSKLSGVSLSHLGRIEQGQRQPSTHTLQKIAKPLGFDLYELLVAAGHLLPDPSNFSEERRGKLRAEMSVLSARVESDTRRIREIANRLLLSYPHLRGSYLG